MKSPPGRTEAGWALKGVLPERVRGDMLPSILLVPGTVFCRLENICRETDTWLEDEDFWWQGKHVVRKAGDPVPHALMKSWRAARAKDPAAFEKDDVLVWSSLNAYQNEVASTH